MKKIDQLLNILMGAFAGAWIGHGIYVLWNFKTRPELYAMGSAPWYTSILVGGAVTLAVWVMCIAIKAILKRYIQKAENKPAA